MELALRALKIAAIAYAAGALLVWWASGRLMFQPQAPGYRDSPGVIRILVDGDTIAAVWLPNPAARFTVFFSHGNAEDVGDDLPYLEEMRVAGFSVFAYDYRGYGLSTGRPSERRAHADAAAAFKHLTGEIGIAPERVIVHGRSLGGGPSTVLAAREPVAGLVLESTFTSIHALVAATRILPFDRFRNRARLKDVRAPVLVIHGVRDEVVPFAHGERLYDAARGPKRHFWVENAGHNDLVPAAGEGYWEALRDFARSLEAAPSPRP
jgi:abhydrolase domain-containing protein 17